MTNRVSMFLITLCLATTASLGGCDKEKADAKPNAAADGGKKSEGYAKPDPKAGGEATPAGDVKADGGETPDAEPKADGDAPAEEAKADAP